MICRLLQEQSGACIECGSTIVSLPDDAKLLKYRDMNVSAAPRDTKAKLKTAAGAVGFIGGYIGIAAASVLWPPAIGIIFGGGIATVGYATWRNRGAIADVELLPVATPKDAVEIRGIARKLSDSMNGALVEEYVIRNRYGVLLRKTNIVPFLVEAEPKLVVDGVVRVTSKPSEKKLKKSDLETLGIPIPVSGKLGSAVIREGDRVRVTGAIATEMLPELAFHRDAGEVNVMRGAAKAVVAIACEESES